MNCKGLGFKSHCGIKKYSLQGELVVQKNSNIFMIWSELIFFERNIYIL